MLLNTIKRVGIPFRNVLPNQQMKVVRHAAAYEGEGKTTVRVINQEHELGLMIDTYATYGFRLNNGVTVLGPMAIFPRSVMSWQVTHSGDITEQSLRLFKLLEPKVDLVIVGLESKERAQQALVWSAARANNLNVEVLPTEHACSTFNFLNAEGRCVAAALIPPLKLHMNEDDMLQNSLHYEDLFNKSIY